MIVLLEIATVMGFVAFLLLVLTLYRTKKQAPQYDEAANLPFALPDEIETNQIRSIK